MGTRERLGCSRVSFARSFSSHLSSRMAALTPGRPARRMCGGRKPLRKRALFLPPGAPLRGNRTGLWGHHDLVSLVVVPSSIQDASSDHGGRPSPCASVDRRRNQRLRSPKLPHHHPSEEFCVSSLATFPLQNSVRKPLVFKGAVLGWLVSRTSPRVRETAPTKLRRAQSLEHFVRKVY
jgi:hypothetical protein